MSPLPSASSISVTATTWVHVIKLSGYSHAKRLLGTGEHVESAVFQAAGHFWRVMVYPNGNQEKCVPGSIALYLKLVGKSKGDVIAQFQFSLLRHGTKLASVDNSGRITKAPVTFNANMSAWGFEDVGTKGELEKPEYLEDDTIVVRCNITVANESAVKRRDLPELGLFLHGGSSKKMKASQNHAMAQPPAPSASTIDVTASTGCHIVKFSGYSRTNMLTGKHIKSAEFKEAGHAWRIWCSPGGESVRHVSLYLELAGVETIDVHAEFQFSLVPHAHSLSGEGACDVRVTFGADRNKCLGFKDFMAMEELEESEYLKDDCFYIRCNIDAMNKPVAKLLLHDGAEALGLLCCCDDDNLCDNIHDRDKMKKPHVYGQPWRCLGMILSCLPIQSKPSRRDVSGIKYSRL